jgi:hypothetical protein
MFAFRKTPNSCLLSWLLSWAPIAELLSPSSQIQLWLLAPSSLAPQLPGSLAPSSLVSIAWLPGP